MPAHLTYIKRMVQGRFAQRFLKNKNKKLKCNLACVAGVFLAEERKRTAKRTLPHSSRDFALVRPCAPKKIPGASYAGK